MNSFDMQKTTACGRFTVTIVSKTSGVELSTVQDHARSLKNLSDVLTEGATCAFKAAVDLLDRAKKPVPPHVAEGETYDHDFGNPRNVNEMGTGNIK